MKILVCDDDPLMGIIVSNIIGTDGHEVEVAFDGQVSSELNKHRPVVGNVNGSKVFFIREATHTDDTHCLRQV